MGPYKIRIEGHDKSIIIKAKFTIDPVTGCFEIIQYKDKRADTIANLVDKTWLCRYPCPKILTYKCVNGFRGHVLILSK